MSLEPTSAQSDARPVAVAGEGAHVVTADGRRLLDFASGADAPFGHDLLADAGALMHVPSGCAEAQEERLAERLCEISFADRVRFLGTASEAAELALCAMWKFQEAKKQPKRRRIVTLENGSHGQSALVRLALGEGSFPRALESLEAYFDRAAFNDLASVRAAVGAHTAGILIEPLQRNGTFEPPQNGFLMELRGLADEYDLVLAYDESACGVGRTGALWAHEWSGAAPDVMILGNNLAGGIPFGALAMTERVGKALGKAADKGGAPAHPLAVAAAHATLDKLLEPDLLRQIEERTWALEERLYWIRRNNPGVVEAHYGMGLWQTLKLKVPARALQEKLWEHGLATAVGSETILGLLPALSVTRAEIDQAATALGAACASLAPVA